MKMFRRTYVLLVVLLSVLYGCSPDEEAPVVGEKSPEVALAFHDYGPFCYPTQHFKVVDDAGSVRAPGGDLYGSLFMGHNSDSTFLYLELGPGWFIEKAAWYIGGINFVPLTQNGLLNVQGFPEGHNPSSYVNSYTFESAFIEQNTVCHGAVFWCEAVMVDFFQGPINSTRRNLWARQTPLSNGYMIQLCYEPCRN